LAANAGIAALNSKTPANTAIKDFFTSESSSERPLVRPLCF
jgi:hypothetical protein